MERVIEGSREVVEYKEGIVGEERIWEVLEEENDVDRELNEAKWSQLEVAPNLPMTHWNQQEKVATPANWPPYRWTGDNATPVEMARYLFGRNGVFDGGFEDCVVHERYGKHSPVAKTKRYPVRRARYKDIFNELKRIFLENANLDIYVHQSKPTKEVDGKTKRNAETHASQGRLTPTRSVVAYCARCRDEKTHVPVVRFKVVEEAQIIGNDPNLLTGTVRLYFELLEVYYHPVVCKGVRQGHDKCGVKEEGEGWVIHGPKEGNNVFIEGLRRRTFGAWVQHLEKFKDPAAVQDLEAFKGVPAPELIQFQGASSNDIRGMISVMKPGDLPPQINEAFYTQYVAWQVYNNVNMMGEEGIRQFTRFIPHDNPIIYGRTGGAVIPGNFPLETPRKYPIHLFVKGTYLLVGGFQKKGDGTIAKMGDGTELVHQAAHGDFKNEWFETAEECPLLAHLEHPRTFNVALKSTRSIWVDTVENVKTINKNQSLVLNSETVHGGMTTYFNAASVDWFPSLHAVIDSSRYPRKENEVQLQIGAATYYVPAHLRGLDDAAYMVGLERLKENVEDWANEGDKKKRKLTPRCKKMVKLMKALCEEIGPGEEEEEEKEEEEEDESEGSL